MNVPVPAPGGPHPNLHFRDNFGVSCSVILTKVEEAIVRLSALLSLSLFLLSAVSFAQVNSTDSSQSNAAPEHFNIDDIDRSVNPCVDFYAYTCNKWMAANPIPSDQASWSHWDKMQLWNEQVLKDALEAASKDDSQRTPVQQKIGDYYASCMDESAVDQKGISAIQPELDRIAALSDKSQLAEEIAHIHALEFQLAPASNSGSSTVAFGFSSGQDLDNASMVVAQVD